MLELPLDIIEKIIISSDVIVTTYNTILILVKSLVDNYTTTITKYNSINHTINHTIHHLITLRYQKYLSIYNFLLNDKTIANIYNHSGWYNYFIETINHNYEYNNNNPNPNPNPILDINFNILKPLLLNSESIVSSNSIEYIKYIELNINKTNIKLLIHKILLYWKLNIKELEPFIILLILLSSNNIYNNNNNVENHLYMKFIKEKEKETLQSDSNTPCYFISNNNIIPLFQKYIGMGYTYNIAWDFTINKYIGFIFGGSSGDDYYYFDTKLKTYLQKNKNERLQYLKNNKKIISKHKYIDILNDLDDKPISYYEKYCI